MPIAILLQLIAIPEKIVATLKKEWGERRYKKLFGVNILI